MPPPQIKQDLNRSGWETTDMPSVCERCLPDNPMVQMTKEDYGEECKICTRPFTVFRWKADRTSRQKRSIICLTCARLKNCCQCCMLDLNFGLPITIRDAALKMIAPGPQSEVNREYYAQNNERAIEEGKGGIEEAYAKTDEKAMELLKKLARSEPYSKRIRREEEDGPDQTRMDALPAPESTQTGNSTGPIRTQHARKANKKATTNRRDRPPAAHLVPKEEDWLPPNDPNIKSLFAVGVEDDLPEYKIREFFGVFGTLQSVVCSHRSHCAFINFVKRGDAERAADSCRGRAVISGCPLRVTWGKPKQLDTMDRDQRLAHARAGRDAVGSLRKPRASSALEPPDGRTGTDHDGDEDMDSLAAVAPPGQDDVNYASLTGD